MKVDVPARRCRGAVLPLDCVGEPDLPDWETLHPLLRTAADNLGQHVPGRYRNQVAEAERTHPAWVVSGTPFATIAVNNTYPTGTHTDRGDLEAGFSTIVCVRRGNYSGGQLIFPAYRVAADMHDGDLILMDAHEWHGNVPIVCPCGKRLNGPLRGLRFRADQRRLVLPYPHDGVRFA